MIVLICFSCQDNTYLDSFKNNMEDFLEDNEKGSSKIHINDIKENNQRI